MVDLQTLIHLQITIILLIAAGYILTKSGVLDSSSRTPFTNLLIDFVLPCNIIVSFMMDFNKDILLSCLAVLLVSCGIQILAAFFGKFFFPHTSPRELAVLHYGMIVSNAGFVGFPIILGMYGEKGLLFASIYLIPQRIVMWSAGVTCFTGTRGTGVIRKILTHPCIVSVEIGMVLMIFQISLPVGLDNAIRHSSNCTTALSMLVIGIILSEVPLKEIFSKKILWFCVMRLIVFPIIVLFACRLLSMDSLVTGVCTVLSGMPAAASVAIVPEKYGGDSEYGVKIVCSSILLSLITIPAIGMLAAHIV